MADLIDRQAAIEAIEDHIKAYTSEMDGYNMARRHMRELIEVLPSAQPEIIRCGECKHRYTEGENVVYNVCELNHNKVQPDDWFCADAERRTDG